MHASLARELPVVVLDGDRRHASHVISIVRSARPVHGRSADSGWTLPSRSVMEPAGPVASVTT
jgi:hypothetical protein